MKVKSSNNAINIIGNTLSRVDPRLVDHGRNVAILAYEIFKLIPEYPAEDIKNYSILAILHDIGAYKTEEIDKMTMFETSSVQDHSIYGYLFLKHFSPLGDLALAVLHHHTDYSGLPMEFPAIMKAAQIINIADRIELGVRSGKSAAEMESYLLKKSGAKYDPQIVKLFVDNDITGRGTTDMEKMTAAFKKLWDGYHFSQNEINYYLNMIVMSIDFRSRGTVPHTITTAAVSRMLGGYAGLGAEEMKKLYTGAMLHDLGKTGVPVEILGFPGKLSEADMEVMKTHVAMTEEILRGNVDESILKIAVRHHEKLDGSGYHHGLTGDELSLSERILAVADIICALAEERSYKKVFDNGTIVGILSQMSGDGLIDKEIAACSIKHMEEVRDEINKAAKPVNDTYEKMNDEFMFYQQKALERAKTKRSL